MTKVRASVAGQLLPLLCAGRCLPDMARRKEKVRNAMQFLSIVLSDITSCYHQTWLGQRRAPEGAFARGALDPRLLL